jgi:hypothetical protein
MPKTTNPGRAALAVVVALTLVAGSTIAQDKAPQASLLGAAAGNFEGWMRCALLAG